MTFFSTILVPSFLPQIPALYRENWSVADQETGNNYGQEEARDGYDTQGSYYVNLPDGRLQKVNYYVNGESGYVAEVSYEGEAHYPDYQPTQSYKAAPAQPYQTVPNEAYKSAPTPSYKAPPAQAEF